MPIRNVCYIQKVFAIVAFYQKHGRLVIINEKNEKNDSCRFYARIFHRFLDPLLPRKGASMSKELAPPTALPPAFLAKNDSFSTAAPCTSSLAATAFSTQKRKRGRPRKNPPIEILQAIESNLNHTSPSMGLGSSSLPSPHSLP